MPEIISRKEAISKGLSKYFTNAPCRNGHVAERYVKSATCEDCIRESRALIISKPGEIMFPSTQKEKIDLQRAKLALQVQKFQLQIQNQQLRTVEKQVKVTVKTKLIDAIIVVHPLDYEMVCAMVWGAAVARDPLLRLEDIVSGRQLDEMRHVMYCFPEDKYDLLTLTMQIYEQRFQAEFDEKQKVRQLALAALSSDSRWPEGDPK